MTREIPRPSRRTVLAGAGALIALAASGVPWRAAQASTLQLVAASLQVVSDCNLVLPMGSFFPIVQRTKSRICSACTAYRSMLPSPHAT